VDALQTFVQEQVLPALAQSKAFIVAERQKREAEIRTLVSVQEMAQSIQKSLPGAPS
jgi:hypothetical protein